MKHTFLLPALGLAMSLDPLAAAPLKEHHLGSTGLIGRNQLSFAESAMMAVVSGAFRSVQKPAEISGATYDWEKTKQPERPYRHAYHQTLVMKIFLASKQPDGGCDVELDFEQAPAVIKRLDNITLGMPKIVYLVGWQHNGHDAKYPDWSVVNPRLKRQQDATALDSLKWLMAMLPGQKAGTVHIDAFHTLSPRPHCVAPDPSNTLVAYSAKGCKAKAWELPPDWKTVQRAVVSEITTEGLKEIRMIEITDGSMVLDMEPGQGLAVEAEQPL